LFAKWLWHRRTSVGSNHTLISDRLPDPAQFARCFRILHTLWFVKAVTRFDGK